MQKMINKLLKILGTGIKQVQLNAHLLLVTVLLVVIPGLFLWVTQSYFDAAYQNIDTAARESVSLLHDSIELVVEDAIYDNKVQSKLNEFVDPQDKIEITKISIIEKRGENYLIRYSSQTDEIGLNAGLTQHQAYTMSLAKETSILEVYINQNRTWQAFREVNIDSSTYYIFSQHSFAPIDNIMLSRQQQMYLVLPVLFLFLIALAYWLIKQTHWRKQNEIYAGKLNEQMLFTNTIAHELRAPLTAIRGYLSFFLESNSLTTEEKKYAENMNLSSERMLALISDFLEVARIQSGNLKLEFLDVDIRDTFRAVESEFKSVAAKKDLELSVSLPSEPVMAHTDTKRLQQVLTNLVSNALKYTKEGSVTLALEQTRLKTIIRIKDTGLGIAAEDQHKLFSAFTRVGKADKSGVTGTGLGMWITKQLVELLHGEINVESIEGVGTHVKLTFDV